MCEFTQREYRCGHFRFIAARWCNRYRTTHRRCSPDVAHFEYRQLEICGICQRAAVPDWFHLVKSRSAPVAHCPATHYPPKPCPSSYPAVAPHARRRRALPKPERPPIPLFSATE